MARPTEFDRDIALSAAMQLFWRQGYTATSLSQLLEVMDISRSSFYAAFTDKRSLYLEALTLFSDRTRAILLDPAIADPVERIRQFFMRTISGVPQRRSQRGCMMVNTVLELADVDDGLSDEAAACLDRIQGDFERLLADAEDVDASLSAASGGRFLMLVNEGLRVAARKKRPRRELEAMVDDAFTLLGLSPA